MIDPDIKTLVGFVRNRLREGKTAVVVLNKRRVYVIPSDLLGSQIPGLLVSSERGESVYLKPEDPVHPATFTAGGFSLTRAAILSRVFRALSSTIKQRVRTHPNDRH